MVSLHPGFDRIAPQTASGQAPTLAVKTDSWSAPVSFLGVKNPDQSGRHLEEIIAFEPPQRVTLGGFDGELPPGAHRCRE